MINKISDKIVFSGLKLIKHGKLNVITFQNKKLQFGNDGTLEVSIKINKQRHFMFSGVDKTRSGRSAIFYWVFGDTTRDLVDTLVDD